MNIIASMILSALLKTFWKVASEAFFESAIQKSLVFTLEKLAARTTNTLDDEIVAEIKKRLETQQGGA